MSRVFTRILILTTFGGFAIAPSLAFAAECTSNPPTATVTTLQAPKQAVSGEELTITADVSPAKATPPGKARPDHKGTKHEKKHRHDKKHEGDGKGAGKGGGTKDGTGVKKGKGKGHKHNRIHETGEVTFVVDGKTLAPVPITRDKAAEKIELSQGSHTVTATYGGDANYASSSAAPVTFTVN